MVPSEPNRRRVYSWALYDWANSAFATTVMAGFFPVFFKQYWSVGQSATDSTFNLGIANSLASLLMVVIAPMLGAIADRGGVKKRLLLTFTFIGVAMTAALWLVPQGGWLPALILYALALTGFSGGVLFCDALLVDVAEERQLDRVSALGFALGYIGGGLLFALNVVMTLSPQAFGFVDSAEAVRFSFLTVAIWWALFTIPLWLWVDEPGGGRRRVQGVVRESFRQLSQTVHKLRQLRMTFLFLAAYWLYIDGVDTVIRMAVDYGLSLGFEASSLLTALLITQFVGFPAAIVFGRVGERLGARNGIMIGLAVYLAVIVLAYRMSATWEFYALAVVIGLVQGGVQALSRSYYARLIPRDQAGEFFGFYNMLGKFAAILGPVMMGWVGVVSGDSRLSILSVAVLFVAGGALLMLVDDKAGHEAARALKRAPRPPS